MHRAEQVRRTAGMAALLPALFLAALYVAAPFAGTTTHPIAHRAALHGAAAPAATGPAAGGAVRDAVREQAEPEAGGLAQTALSWSIGAAVTLAGAGAVLLRRRQRLATARA